MALRIFRKRLEFHANNLNLLSVSFPRMRESRSEHPAIVETFWIQAFTGMTPRDKINQKHDSNQKN